MAAIDKTYYTTKEQYDEIKAWADKLGIGGILYEYMDGNDGEPRPLWNTSCEFDEWLWKNCPFKIVQDRLKEQYGTSGSGYILVKYKDGASSDSSIKEIILHQSIYNADYFSIIEEISRKDYDIEFFDENTKVNTNIIIYSITNVSVNY